MPIGTLTAIGAGLSAAGAVGGLLSRPDRRSAESFVPGANEALLDQAQEMRDPSYGFGQFRRLARDAAGTMDQTLQATAATGGSERLARTRQQAQTQRQLNDVMDQFGQFRLSADQQAANIQNQAISNLMRGQRMAQRQNLQRSRSTMSLFNNIAGIGGTLFGQGLGSGGGPQSVNVGPNSGPGPGRRVPPNGGPRPA